MALEVDEMKVQEELESLGEDMAGWNIKHISVLMHKLAELYNSNEKQATGSPNCYSSLVPQ